MSVYLKHMLENPDFLMYRFTTIAHPSLRPKLLSFAAVYFEM